MVTLGDIFALIAGLVGISLAAWAAMVVSALLFPSRSAASAREFENHPWRAFGIGLVVLIPFAIGGTILAAIPNPLAKVLGILVYLSVLLLGAFGAGGLARLIGQRVQTTGGTSTFYGGYAKGAALVVMICHLPFIGWFLLFPVILICSLGAAARSLLTGRASSAPWPGAEAESR